MKNKVFIGYMGKDELAKCDWDGFTFQGAGNGCVLPEIVQKKSTKVRWNEEDWPPQKVKVTIALIK